MFYMYIGTLQMTMMMMMMMMKELYTFYDKITTGKCQPNEITFADNDSA